LQRIEEAVFRRVYIYKLEMKQVVEKKYAFEALEAFSLLPDRNLF
jgi:hypothetical protein